MPEELNTYDVLLNDWVVFSQASLDATIARLGGGGSDEEATGAAADEEVEAS